LVSIKVLVILRGDLKAGCHYFKVIKARTLPFLNKIFGGE